MMPSRGDSLGEKMASASGFCEGGFFSLPDFGGPGAIRPTWFDSGRSGGIRSCIKPRKVQKAWEMKVTRERKRRTTSENSGENRGPTILLYLIPTLAGLLSGMQVGEARPWRPWCARYVGGVTIDCAYVSHDQCMLTVSGVSGFCTLNPTPPPPPPPSRRHRQSY
jgi:hypothetical protein